MAWYNYHLPWNCNAHTLPYWKCMRLANCTIHSKSLPGQTKLTHQTETKREGVIIGIHILNTEEITDTSIHKTLTPVSNCAHKRFSFALAKCCPVIFLADMSRVANNKMHTTFSKHHKLSPCILAQLKYRLWWGIQTIKVVKCSPNYRIVQNVISSRNCLFNKKTKN